MTDHPFVYISSLRRTGSTVLSEALTSPPHSFIFREPLLSSNRFVVHPPDADLMLGYGVDLHEAVKFVPRGATRLFCPRSRMVGVFKTAVVDKLIGKIAQLGVKEIIHDHWQAYLKWFPGMKVVVTGRDPRDVYLSLRERMKAGKGSWTGSYDPRRVADDLNRQFRLQLAMIKEFDHIKVKYEDICEDNSLFEKVKEFVGSPVPVMGAVGAFNASTSDRVDEAARHGGRITSKQVARWRREPDERLRREACETLERMPEYGQFWNYKSEPSG